MRSATPWGRPPSDTEASCVPAVWTTSVARPNARSMGPCDTSVCCTRSFGTDVTDRQMTPRRIVKP